MKMGRFIVDTHVHSQRHTAGPALKGSRDHGDPGKVMGQMEVCDNSPRLLYDMQCYGVDMCILEPALGTTGESNVDQVKKYPDKFAASAWPFQIQKAVQAGEVEWSIESFCRELDEMLSTGNYVGVGEMMPPRPPDRKGKYPRYPDEHTVIDDMMHILEVCRAHKVPFRYHTGLPGGCAVPYHGSPTTFNPLYAHDLAMAFPDTPIILEHAGIEGGWWEHFYEQCLHVAAGHKNVYLETGRFWTDLYYKPLQDTGIGPEKLIWGTDWGTSLPVYQYPASGSHGYIRQNVKEGIPRHQVDIWGWSLRQVERLDISQDDLNLILGGNAVRLYDLRSPGGLTRMFKFVD
ncbi:MAG: amidohydrolase family protein [Dehalococcoidales bacterium]|nr:amidohydrolase family protein [Dehalococcoidales bacterium]